METPMDILSRMKKPVQLLKWQLVAIIAIDIAVSCVATAACLMVVGFGYQGWKTVAQIEEQVRMQVSEQVARELGPRMRSANEAAERASKRFAGEIAGWYCARNYLADITKSGELFTFRAADDAEKLKMVLAHKASELPPYGNLDRTFVSASCAGVADAVAKRM